MSKPLLCQNDISQSKIHSQQQSVCQIQDGHEGLGQILMPETKEAIR